MRNHLFECLADYLNSGASALRPLLTGWLALIVYAVAILAPMAAAHAATPVRPTAASASHSNAYILHVMHKGDTLDSVAKQYGVPLSSLKTANSAFNGYFAPTAVIVPYTSAMGSSFTSLFNVYTIGKGESLGDIAARYNRSVKELTNLNSSVMPVSTVSAAKEGTRILVPVIVSPSKATGNNSLKPSEQKVASAVSSLSETLTDSKIKNTGQHLTDRAINQAAGMATSAAGQGVEVFLNKRGTAKVGINANVNSGQVDYSLDYLHPLLETPASTVFGQVGARTSNDRKIGNVGLGYRTAITDGLTVGSNMFLDQDFTRNHTRASVGVEAWTEAARLSANAYTPVSGWKKSSDTKLNSDPDIKILQERPAKGWDVNLEGPVPGLPQVALTSSYFQWKGDKVDASGSQGALEKNPKGYSAGVKWQPVPLLGFNAEHSKVSGSKSDLNMGMSLDWSFDRSMKSQLDPSKAYAVKPLGQARNELVKRNYEIVLEYREKDKNAPLQPLAFPLDAVTAMAGQQGQGPAVTGVQDGYVVTYSSDKPGMVDVDSKTGYLTSNPSAQSLSATITAHEFNVSNSVRLLNDSQRIASYRVDLQAQKFTPSVSNLNIAGVLQVGQTLTASYVFADNDGDPKNDATNNASTVLWSGGALQGHAELQYPLGAADVGKVLTFTVTPKNLGGDLGAMASVTTANAPSGIGGGTSPPGIVSPGGAPVATQLDIAGVLQVGQSLTGSYTFADNDGDASNDAANNASTTLWTGGGTSGDSDLHYTLTAADLGKVLTFSVTPKTVNNTVGLVASVTTAEAPSGIGGGTNPPGVVVDPTAIPTASQLDITGVLQVGQSLTGSYVFADNDGNPNNDTSNNASTSLWTGGGTRGNTNLQYLLTAADLGKVLTFNVRPKTASNNTVGVVASVTTADAPSGIGGGTHPPGTVVDPTAIPTASQLDITGVLQVGQSLTGSYVFADNDGNPTNDVANNASTTLWTGGGTMGDSDLQYLLTAGDLGKVLTFNVLPKTFSNAVGVLSSVTTADAPSGIGGGTNPPGVVVDPSAIPTASQLDIAGVLHVGQTLTASYLFADNDGNPDNDVINNASTTLWTGGGTAGDRDLQYLLTAADAGKVLTFSVSPRTTNRVVGVTASVTTVDAPSGIGGGTTPPGTVVNPAAPKSIVVNIAGGGALTGRPQVGQMLEASTVCETTCGPLSYQWKLQRSNGSTEFDPVSGATSVNYTPMASQQRRELKVDVNVSAP